MDPIENKNVVYFDDELDESFHETSHEPHFQSKVESKFEQTEDIYDKNNDILTAGELMEIDTFIKKKTHVELLSYLKKLLLYNIPNNSDIILKTQIEQNVLTKYNNTSKKNIIDIIKTLVNKKNKNIIFEKEDNNIYNNAYNNADKIISREESREELRQKLRNKIKMSRDNNNPQKMYEKLQEELEKTNLNDSNDTNDTDTTSKKKKKNKKIDPRKLQSQLVSQMSNFIKNNNSVFGSV